MNFDKVFSITAKVLIATTIITIVVLIIWQLSISIPHHVRIEVIR